MAGLVKGPAQTVVERPPPGPAQGILPAPAWLVVVIAVSLALLAGLGLRGAWQKRRRP
jgi:hypothetical protein